MRRVSTVALFLLLACAPPPQQVRYPNAVKGNRAIGRYFGANSKDLFHRGDEGLVHFDGSAWTPVPGFANFTGDLVSAGPGKVWALGAGRLERVDAAGTREDFSSQVTVDGLTPFSLGAGNGEVFVCSTNPSKLGAALFRLSSGSFQRVPGTLDTPVTFELIRGPDDAFVSSTFPELALNVWTFVPTLTNYGVFDGTTVSGPLLVKGEAQGVNTAFSAASPRVPKSFGVLGGYVFDGAWLHPSNRPPPSGQFYLRSDGRLGVLANLYGAGGIGKAYAVSYDPQTGQSMTTLLDVNGEVEVTWWTAAWNGTGWVDGQELFRATACIGATCGGSRTAYTGELDDGTMVVSGTADDASVVWFVKP